MDQDEFCERMWPRLVAACVSYTGSTPLGEDLAQEALTRALVRWKRISTAITFPRRSRSGLPGSASTPNPPRREPDPCADDRERQHRAQDVGGPTGSAHRHVAGGLDRSCGKVPGRGEQDQTHKMLSRRRTAGKTGEPRSPGGK